MKTYTTRVTVPANRRITVELPEDIPEGEAEVTVCADGRDDTLARDFSATGAELLAWIENRRPIPPGYRARTKSEVDAELRAMRDEWDRR